MGSHNRYLNDLAKIAEGAASDIVDKYGETTNADSGVETDCWDQANTTADVPVWVAPTQARVHALVSADVNDACGFGTLTLTGNISDTETVTIGAKVYTFQTTLTNVDGNVKIGASASDTIDNFIAAINLASGAGTTYATLMTANAVEVIAYAGAGDTMLLFDMANTEAATTETSATAAWTAVDVPAAGTGARVIRVYGLKTWDLSETYEDVPLNGTTAVNTANSYVIIHRMRVLRNGAIAGGPNKGLVTATAATDTTVTAAILAGNGSTLMAIYGISSLDRVWLDYVFATAEKSAASTTVKIVARVNQTPDVQLTNFTVLRKIGLSIDGTSAYIQEGLKLEVQGPAILKISANSNAANIEVAAGWGGFKVLV